MLNSVKSTFTLNDGVKIPVIGYGSYFEAIATSNTVHDIKEKDYKTIKSYLKTVIIENGYIHIDSAESYKSEIAIGRAIKELNIDRTKLFITSKIWTNYKIPQCSPHFRSGIKTIGRKETLETVNNALQYLGTDYIDLYLVHSPHSLTKDGKDVMEIYLTLLELKEKGKIRSVGVSNFGINHLKTMIEVYRLPPPSVNQIHLHPFSRDLQLLTYCKKYNILIEAYSSLFKGKNFKFRGFEEEINCFDHPVLTYIASKYGKNSAQIMLRWSIQMGYVPIFKSTKSERIKKYANIFDFTLTGKEIEIINLLNQGYSANFSWQPMRTEIWDYKITRTSML